MSRRAAFDFLCGLLSLDESPGLCDRLRREAKSAELSVPDLVALASEHWISAAVAPALRRTMLRDALSKDAIDYFEGVATLNRQRNGDVRLEAMALTRMFNGIGVVPIFLKGGANLLAGLYFDPAMRMMLDLDVLVPPAQLSTCVAVMQSHGYRQIHENGFSAQHHYPPLGRPGAAVSVELHVDPLDLPYQHFLASAEVRDTAVEQTLDNVRFAIPAVWCRIVHCIAHAQYSDHACAYGHLPLRDMLDTALLSRSDVGWEAIAARFGVPGPGGRAAPFMYHLLATGRLLGGRVPQYPSSISSQALFRRARLQAGHPGIERWTRTLMRPWLLLRRALSHPTLRRRFRRCLIDPAWYARQWQMLR